MTVLRTDFAAPTCSVEIYPANATAGSTTPIFTFTNDRIRAVTTVKDLGENDGQFSITLSPGTPGNPNGSWAKAITPMSLVLIGMQRAGRFNIVMMGVVRLVRERTEWGARGTTRVITITGDDMSYYFTAYNYYAMGLLGATAGSVIGEALNIGATSSAQLLSNGYMSGTPQQIGLHFIDSVMFGSTLGLLQNTKVLYKGSTIKLGSMFGTAFAEYPNADVMLDMDYVTNEESWFAKFQNIFPAPWYEFFVTTAPVGYYGQVAGQSPGTQFSMQSMPKAASVQATIVARINPNPVLEVTVPTAGGGGTITGVDASAWSALTVFEPDEAAPRIIDIGFDIGNTCNYFAVNPTVAGVLFGAGNALSNTWLQTQETAIDTSSIIDLGYRPAILPTVWFGDSTGDISRNPSILENFPSISAQLIARIASEYGPLHLMASGTVMLPLRPDIMPGQVFRFPLFRDGVTWDFYITAVQHSFVYGGDSTTTLTLTRGLQTDIYRGNNSRQATSPNAFLQGLLQGQAVRTPSGYVLDGSRAGIQFFGPSSNIQAILGQISTAFYAPG